jgi:MFS family permease
LKALPKRVFPTIVVAQFCGTSLWFAGNAALAGWHQPGWPDYAISYVTGSVQAGFIGGTLFFSLLALADKHSPSRLFFFCCLAGGVANSLALVDPSSFQWALISRSLTGFSLAGVYPVGMKIASDWQEKALGHWLGALVGALVLGAALPYGLKLMPLFVRPDFLLSGVSVLAAFGGLLVLLTVPDGPYRRKGKALSFTGIRDVFHIHSFRSPAYGYFGHMWELYAFWAFVPWSVHHYAGSHQQLILSESLPVFLIIAMGAAGCYFGGLWSFRIGSERVAFYSLLCSGCCCALSPIMWTAPAWLYLTFMGIWGFFVVADSPQFSALVARNAPPESRGTALTLVNCIGFAITIVSIHLLSLFEGDLGDYLFVVLAAGPIIGIYFMREVI